MSTCPMSAFPASESSASPVSAEEAQADAIMANHNRSIHEKTDRQFGWLMVAQWLFGILLALVVSPRTWLGAESSTHPHVLAAIFLGGAITGFPAFLAFTRPGEAFTRHVIAAGGYPAAEAERAAGRTLDVTVVPPGVDLERFVPLDSAGRAMARRRFDLSDDAEVVVAVSRLVPRKGFDVAIRAVARLAARRPDLVLVIAGAGRDRERLEKLARSESAPVRFLGRVSNDDLPLLYGCADVSVMMCRNRWAGLEQEGFGIVFVEAAACGVPAIAGASGGAAEAVADGVTGHVIADPRDVNQLVDRLDEMLSDDDRRSTMGRAARERVAAEFSYDVLARRLGDALGVWS